MHEATALTQFLVERGVNPDDLYKEWASFDTVANAFFTLVWHAIPAG